MMPSRTILIVEDEQIIALALKLALEDLGFVVCGVAATPEPALALAKAHRPDVVLMDVRLRGGGDGVAVAREIHAMIGCPVIYLTGSTETETLTRIRAAHPATILTKPVQPQKLEETIRSVLGESAVPHRNR